MFYCAVQAAAREREAAERATAETARAAELQAELARLQARAAQRQQVIYFCISVTNLCLHLWSVQAGEDLPDQEAALLAATAGKARRPSRFAVSSVADPGAGAGLEVPPPSSLQLLSPGTDRKLRGILKNSDGNHTVLQSTALAPNPTVCCRCTGRGRGRSPRSAPPTRPSPGRGTGGGTPSAASSSSSSVTPPSR